jgi:hypothetical protein
MEIHSEIPRYTVQVKFQLLKAKVQDISKHKEIMLSTSFTLWTHNYEGWGSEKQEQVEQERGIRR